MSRNRLTKAEKIARGTLNVTEAKQFDEVIAAPFDMSVPSDLGEIATQFWIDTVPELVRMGLLSAGDRGNLKAMAQSWGEYEELRTIINEQGYTVMGHNGLQINPHYKVMGYAFDRYFELSKLFAMTPQSRVNMNAKLLGNKSKVIDQAVIGNTDAATYDSPVGLSLVQNVANL